MEMERLEEHHRPRLGRVLHQREVDSGMEELDCGGRLLVSILSRLRRVLGEKADGGGIRRCR